MVSVKRSQKSISKKRSTYWEEQKIEIAKELGIWSRIVENGWADLSAEDSGKIGGVLSQRKNKIK